MTKLKRVTNECWTLNFKPLAASLEIAKKGHSQFKPVHWFWWQAYLNPGELQMWLYEEGLYEYERNALYDPETELMHTNVVGCPWMVSHHIGSYCEVCGNDERHIHPIPHRRR